jgi:membrane dipeptidase
MPARMACFLALLMITSCSVKEVQDANVVPDEQLKLHAEELANKFIIVDGHIDLPDLLVKERKYRVGVDSPDTLIHSGRDEFDFNRAKMGGLDAPFMSIYIPAEYQQQRDNGKALADSLIDFVVGITKTLPDKFALANTPAEIEENTKAGKISLPMGMENGAPIGNDLKNLKYFYDRGVRYITLTHNKDNQICDASRYNSHTHNGLSAFGKNVVAEMNKLGIIVDISHVDDSTFYQVMEISKAPAIASHSSCRKFSPKATRDMTDDMIKKLAEKDGVIMINFFTAFLDSTAFETMGQFDSLHVNPTNIETVADHIDNVVNIAGIDHVGIGSDYDGVDGSLPVGLEDVSKYPDLIYTLLKRGYSDEDIEKICYKNAFRVWNKVIDVSRELHAQ